MKLNELLMLCQEVASRKKPCLLRAKDNYLFADEYLRLLPQIFLVAEENSLILPSNHLLTQFCLNKKQFNIPVGFFRKSHAYLLAFLSVFLIRKISIYQNAFFITNYNSTNFFHWFLDVLQKVEYLERSIEKEELGEILFLLPADHNLSYMHESISAFNINYRVLKNKELALIRKLNIVPDIAPTGNYRKKTVIDLSKRLRSHFQTKVASNGPASRVYITRKNAKRRKIINEDEILPILIQFGFVVVDFDRLSFIEQISFTLNADVLVSLHGASLTHMLWIRPEGKVLEIRARGDSHNNCYFSLASDLGLNYYYVLADVQGTKKRTQLADFTVDKEDLRKGISGMLG